MLPASLIEDAKDAIKRLKGLERVVLSLMERIEHLEASRGNQAAPAQKMASGG